MELNHENFQKSLEDIKASDEFLARTRTLMQEAAAKPAPRRFPKTAVISGAAAAACIAIITAVGLIGSDEIAIETSDTAAAESTSVCETAAAQGKAEITEDDKVFAAKSEAEITESETSKDAEPEVAAVRSVAEDISDKTEDAAETTTAAVTSEENTAISENADEDAAPMLGNYSYAGGNENEEPTSDGQENINNDAGEGYSDEEIFDDAYDDAYEENSPVGENDPSAASVEPAFTDIIGGNAYSYESFSPSDTEKLHKFLTLVSKDEINAEVTVGDISNDVFSGAAQDLNSELIALSDGFLPFADDGFETIASFSIYDNKSGGLLYTVGIGDGVLSVGIKGGETVSFSSDGTDELLALIL